MFSVCHVLYYAMEGPVASAIDVTKVDLAFFAIAGIITFAVFKAAKADEISVIAKILSIIVGILVIVATFADGIFELTTKEIFIPGPPARVPNMVWLIIVTAFCLANINCKSKSNKKLLTFMTGTIASVIMMYVLNIMIESHTHKYYILYGLGVPNGRINLIVRVVCGIGIIGYYVYGLAKRRKDV